MFRLQCFFWFALSIWYCLVKHPCDSLAYIHREYFWHKHREIPLTKDQLYAKRHNVMTSDLIMRRTKIDCVDNNSTCHRRFSETCCNLYANTCCDQSGFGDIWGHVCRLIDLYIRYKRVGIDPYVYIRNKICILNNIIASLNILLSNTNKHLDQWPLLLTWFKLHIPITPFTNLVYLRL